MPKPLFITLLIAVPILLSSAFGGGGLLVGLALILVGNPVIWAVRKNRYFNSEQFKELRADVTVVVAEHKHRLRFPTRTISSSTSQQVATAARR